MPASRGGSGVRGPFGCAYTMFAVNPMIASAESPAMRLGRGVLQRVRRVERALSVSTCIPKDCWHAGRRLSILPRDVGGRAVLRFSCQILQQSASERARSFCCRLSVLARSLFTRHRRRVRHRATLLAVGHAPVRSDAARRLLHARGLPGRHMPGGRRVRHVLAEDRSQRGHRSAQHQLLHAQMRRALGLSRRRGLRLPVVEGLRRPRRVRGAGLGRSALLRGAL
jgi:hypothetical protein